MIVSGAISVAVREGLEAVTIRRLAQDHGVTPMAMYWHFSDKDSLLDGMAEHLFTAVKLPEPTGGEWDDELCAVLGAFLEGLRPHPAVAVLALTRILASEPGLAIAERVLKLLRDAGFPPEKTAEIGSFLLSSIITLVTSEPGPDRLLDDDARNAAVRAKQATLAALDPQRYPNVIAAAPGLSWCKSTEAYYAMGIDVLVQGIRGLRPL